MKNTNVITIARNNKVFTTSMICYALFWVIVVLASYNILDVKTMTIAAGAVALVVYGVVRLVRRLSMTRVTPLTLERIKKCLKKAGLEFSESNEGLSFTVGEVGIPVKLSYNQAENNLCLVIAIMTTGNEQARAMSMRACMAVMEKMANVRAILCSDAKDEKKIIVKFEVGGRVASLEAFKQGFESNVKLLIDAQGCFMKAGDEISKSMKEAESKAKKIGFYSPMKEKIDNFIKQHPTATEDEVRKYIDSIR